MTKYLFYTMMLSAVVVMAACNKKDDPETIRVEHVTLDKYSINLIVGQTGTLSAIVLPKNAEYGRIVWASDKPTIATVDENGVVTAVTEGSAVITATAAGVVSKGCIVTVNSNTVNVESVTIDTSALELAVGESEKLTVTVLPENATYNRVVWASDKPEIVNVDENGVVTAVAGGIAKITAIAGGVVSGECTVEVPWSHDDIIQFQDQKFLNALLTVQEIFIKDPNTGLSIPYTMDVDTNRDGQISVNEAQQVRGLRLWDIANDESFEISAIPEIKYFTALEYLDCKYNQLSTLNVSNCVDLLYLYCNNNQLTTIDVSSCTDLFYLNCSGNQLTTINVNSCTNLTHLVCSGNRLSTIEVNSCTNITNLNCNDNYLKTLDVSGCTVLSSLNCLNNQLETLDVSSCTLLYSLDCAINQLTTLDVSNCTDLMSLNCSSNRLTTLDVSNCTNIEYLTCTVNKLETLNVSGCSDLKSLYCYLNQLETIDVSDCTVLAYLNCSDNQLSDLNISGCTVLETLLCNNNLLSTMDVSSCTALENLDCSGNQLSSITISSQQENTSWLQSIKSEYPDIKVI